MNLNPIEQNPAFELTRKTTGGVNLVPSHHWARNFSVSDDDIDYLTGLLLERETPLSSADLARALIEHRLNEQTAALQEQYKNVRFYNPALSYDVGQKLMFPALDYRMAVVTAVRPGNNPEYGAFQVMQVEFDDESKGDSRPREFAHSLSTSHRLAEEAEAGLAVLPGTSELTTDDIIEAAGEEITETLEDRLESNSDLVSVARKWFPRSLMLEVNDGHLNLAEAVLDLAAGGPLATAEILEQIGGLGGEPEVLQEFCLNEALNNDNRFDEVGPVDKVLWFLKRLEPSEVLTPPSMLRYTPSTYEEGLLTPEMLALEAEIDDEWSNLKAPKGIAHEEVQLVLIYPHRRMGTLPLNNRLRRIFPTARRTDRVWVTLVDGQDGEEYPGWVVREGRYVFGLTKLYRKHKLPVGAYVTVQRSEEPGKIIVNFLAHRPRTEWVRLLNVKDNQISFEDQKRAIGAEYDELMILGADDITAVDTLHQVTQSQRKSLSALLRMLIAELSRATPQNTVHAKTLYSALNVVRRCPPGPLFAALLTNPDFEHVGNHYWKLSG